jgi:hypothetical protein
MAALETPITPERKAELEKLQTIIDSQEEHTLSDLSKETYRSSFLSESMDSPLSRSLYEEIEEESDEKPKPQMSKKEAAEHQEKESDEKPKPQMSKKEAAEREEDEHRLGAKSSRSSESGPMTRQNQFTIMPFVVNQGDESTCAYVTLSKVLVFNLIGILMDIKMPYVEKINLHEFMQSFVLKTAVVPIDRDLDIYKYISPKGHIILIFFF